MWREAVHCGGKQCSVEETGAIGGNQYTVVGETSELQGESVYYGNYHGVNKCTVWRNQ